MKQLLLLFVLCGPVQAHEMTVSPDDLLALEKRLNVAEWERYDVTYE